jgi:hypothetical protein
LPNIARPARSRQYGHVARKLAHQTHNVESMAALAEISLLTVDLSFRR